MAKLTKADTSRAFMDKLKMDGAGEMILSLADDLAQEHTKLPFDKVKVVGIDERLGEISFLVRFTVHESTLLNGRVSVGDLIEMMVLPGKEITPPEEKPEGRSVIFEDKP